MSALRIVVAVKYVPDIQSERAFADGRVVRDSDDGTLNELDENAIEAALRLREALGEADRDASEVVVVTVGPADAESVLRKAYQLGVDHAVRVTDDALAGSDYAGTAAALAGAIARLAEDRPVDVVLTGMAALDGLGSVVPTLTAAALGWPSVGLVTALVLDGADGAVDADGAGRTLIATRELDGATETVRAVRPAVVSVTDHANDPRMPNFKLMMAARSKPVDVWTLDDVRPHADALAAAAGVPAPGFGTDGARTRVLFAEPRPPRADVEIVIDKGEGGNALAEYLIRNELV